MSISAANSNVMANAYVKPATTSQLENQETENPPEKTVEEAKATDRVTISAEGLKASLAEQQDQTSILDPVERIKKQIQEIREKIQKLQQEIEAIKNNKSMSDEQKQTLLDAKNTQLASLNASLLEANSRLQEVLRKQSSAMGG